MHPACVADASRFSVDMAEMRSIFFIPVFNEINRLPLLLSELEAIELPCNTVLFVNNGSTDGSEHLIRQSGHEFIDLPGNRGIGYGFIKAIEWSLERGYDIFGSLAGNGKMLPSEMNRVLKPILCGEADYVTGSRFLPGGAFPNLPLFRRASIPLVNVFVRLLTGAVLTDATCGYRAFKLKIIKEATFNWRAPWLYTYGFEYYLYAKILLSGSVRWLEVPITMRYPEKGQAYTKIRSFSGWWEMLRPWIRARFDRL